MECPAVTVTNLSNRTISYKVEPIFGYEQSYRSTPTAHTTNVAVYGIRFVLGTDRLAFEGEYTKSEDTENYSLAPQKITNKNDEFKFGARSTFNYGNLFFFVARAGLQATNNIQETTSNSLTTSTQKPLSYAPYGGALVGLHLGRYFTTSLSSTVVLRDISDLSKNDYQNVISVGVGTSL